MNLRAPSVAALPMTCGPFRASISFTQVAAREHALVSYEALTFSLKVIAFPKRNDHAR